MTHQNGNTQAEPCRSSSQDANRPSLATSRRAGRVGAPSPSQAQQVPDDPLHIAAARAQALFSSLSDLTFVIRKGGVIAELYTPRDSEYSLCSENVVGKKLLELLPMSIGQQALYYIEKTFRTGIPQTFTCSYDVLGRSREFQSKFARCSALEVIAVVRDVTDRNKLEREIAETANREQMRIGQDLHDGLGQHLTGITFLTRALESKLAAKALPEATEAAEIGQLVIQALTQTRSLARGLFPVEVESHGLVAALKELALRIEKMFGISCRFSGDDKIVIHNQTTASHLFRLTQEAVNNSMKHGKAKHVVIGLRDSGDHTILRISDDGVGFPSVTLKSKGLGLKIMSYRAQKIGGSLDIQPGEKGGAVVTCSFTNSYPQNKSES